MDPGSSAALLTAAVAAVRARSDLWPDLALVAGSGLAGIAEALTDPTVVPYAQIPGWPPATVPGHVGELVLGRLGGRAVVVARGRAHLYEGYAPAQVTFGVRLFHALGARVLILTNAAGGLNPAYRAGDVMVIEDHLSLPGLAGNHPLIGPNDDAVGPRFPVLRGAYDPALAAAAARALAAAGLTVRRGVYAQVSGPSFETPAEARFLAALGADVVGMSTVPEVVVARHAGMRVLGLSVVSNLVPQAQPSADDVPAGEMHEEVLSVTGLVAERLALALAEVIRRG